MKLSWICKLQHMLQTMAFCLAVATLQYAFTPERPYAPPVAYSLAIGLCTWAVIDFGRHTFASARVTGWPAGWQGIALVAAGIATGYFAGHWIGDALCRTFGWYGSVPALDRNAELRSSVLITVTAGVAGTFWFYARNKSAYLEQQMAEARRHAGEARLRLLEAQLEPHMLFNTLANLRALVALDAARAQEMLDHLIAYLRATLDASRATLHPLADEFARLDDYLALMKIRMGPRLAYTLALPEELGDLPVPPLLLQPLVENSIRHGLEPQREGGRIDVTARVEGTGPRARLVLEVRDSGIGLAVAAIAAEPPQGSLDAAKVAAAVGHPGFGCHQIGVRLATLYGSAGTIELIAQSEGGTCATVQFPIEFSPPLAGSPA